MPTTTPPVPSDATNWGDIPTWVGAVGTCLGTIFLILTAIYAIRSFGQLRSQVSDQETANQAQAEVLKLQSDELQALGDERKREAAERRSAQAKRVLIWNNVEFVGDSMRPFPMVSAGVHNKSGQSIYDVRVEWHRGKAPWPSNNTNVEELGTMLPEVEARPSQAMEYGQDPSGIEAVVRFRDANQVWWLRREDSEPEEWPGPDEQRTGGSN